MFEGLHDTLRGNGRVFFKEETRTSSTTSPNRSSVLTYDSDAPQSAPYRRATSTAPRSPASWTASITRPKSWPGMPSLSCTTRGEALKGGVRPPSNKPRSRRRSATSPRWPIVRRRIAADAQAIVAHIRKGNGSGRRDRDGRNSSTTTSKRLARDLKHNPWKFFWRE